MDVEECYSELGLEAGCSDAEVKAAWRRLAAQWHPDRNDSPQAMRKMQRINRALEEIRRARADGLDELDRAPDPARADRSAPRPAHTVHHSLTATLEEAIAGAARWLQGEVQADCTGCSGTGAQAGPCATCEGSGRVRQPLWFGWAGSQVACRDCSGTGVTPQRCERCEGEGRQRLGRYRCRVQLPAGCREGVLPTITTRAKGPQGAFDIDVSVRVAIAPHALFTLVDDGTIRCEVPVDGFAWMANRWTEVPTPDGLQQMRLRRGALAYRIRGQGFPDADGNRADLIVNVEPIFPEALSPVQEACIDRLVASNTGTIRTPAGKRMAQFRASMAEWKDTA